MSDTDPVPQNLISVEALRGLAPPQLPSTDEGRGIQPPPTIDLNEHKAKTARTLTFVVVGMLGASVIVQYGMLAVLLYHNKVDAIATFEHLFNAVFPVLAGLTGSAVTYYLTKEKT